MRVPVRRLPQTRVSEQQVGFAKGVPALDVTPITSAIEGYRDQLLSEQRDRQKFEINRRVMNEVNELQADFETRRRDPKISPDDFADTTNRAYQDRHSALLGELRSEFDQDLVDDMELRLGTIRQGFFERGLGHQITALKSRAIEGAEDLTRSASQYAGANPNGYASARDMYMESIRLMPDLLESEREDMIDNGLGIIRDAAGKALAIQDPQSVISLLDPNNLTAPYRAPSTGAAGGGAVNVSGLDADRGTVASTLAAGGLSAPVVAGFLGNFDIEGGYGGALGDGGSASGIAQWRNERRANFKRKFGKEPHQATKEEQAQFVLWELNNPAAAGMKPEHATAIKNARTAEEAAELIDKYYERSSGAHRSRRTKAAAGYATSLGTTTAPPSTEVVEGQSLAPPPQSIAEAKTGNAILDDMNGPERLQVLSWAREQLNRVNATRKAEMDVTLGNIEAEALNNGGEIATPLPTEADVLAVYGPVEGPQRWARLQQSKDTGKAITTFRTRSAEDIQRGLDALEPKPGSPTYQTELQIFQAAERAAQQLLNERQSDPAAYAIKYFPSVGEAMKKGTSQYYAELDRVYETLGIDSSRAPLLSAEATRRIVDDYKMMSPAQRLNFMKENFAGMGEDRFRRFVSNMEGTTAREDANIYALLRTYPRPNGEWAMVYQQVLEGREIMDKDPARRPPQEAVNAQFQAQGLKAITNLNADASRAIQETAAALYAMSPQNPRDPKKVNADLYRQALTTALGGSLPVNMAKGQAKDYTILPPKVNEAQFRTWTEGLTAQHLVDISLQGRRPVYGDMKTFASVADIIDDGVFVMVSPGQYMIKMRSDGQPLMSNNSRPPQPFLINIQSSDVVRARSRPAVRRPAPTTVPFNPGVRG